MTRLNAKPSTNERILANVCSARRANKVAVEFAMKARRTMWAVNRAMNENAASQARAVRDAAMRAARALKFT